MKKFIFDGNYRNLAQVEPYFSQFKPLHDKFEEGGNFAYNSLFNGLIDGLKDSTKDNEETAIYLLQSLDSQKNRDSKIEALLKDGYVKLENGGENKKYKKIVQIGTDYSIDSTREYENGTVIYKDGFIMGIMPKGNRNRYYRMYGDRIIMAK